MKVIFITAVQFNGTRQHENIASVRWVDCRNGVSKSAPRATMVKFIDDGNTLQVAGEQGPAIVQVVRPRVGEPYLRTHRDGNPSNDLLSLPTY